MARNISASMIAITAHFEESTPVCSASDAGAKSTCQLFKTAAVRRTHAIVTRVTSYPPPARSHPRKPPRLRPPPADYQRLHRRLVDRRDNHRPRADSALPVHRFAARSLPLRLKYLPP